MRISLVGCFIILALPASFVFAGDLETAMQMGEKELVAIVPEQCPAVDSACPICKPYHNSEVVAGEAVRDYLPCRERYPGSLLNESADSNQRRGYHAIEYVCQCMKQDRS